MVRVGVVGGGAWGTTLSIILAENGHEVSLWVLEPEVAVSINELRENKQFLPGFPLTDKIQATTNHQALADSEFIFFVVPTQHLRGVVKCFVPIVGAAIIVSATKGLEGKTFKLPLEIIGEELKSNNPLVVLSGPNISKEIAAGLPAAATVASADPGVAEAVQKVLMMERFRLYTNKDVIGVQLGGALKNVIALAAGVADGLGLGDNAKAALLVRGLAEIARLGQALGARPETFAGLSGMGDLIVTCSSKLSRNHQLGERLAKGEKLSEIQKSLKTVAEGVPTALSARELGKKLNVPLPITEEVYQVLHEGKDPYRALTDLMRREGRSESHGIPDPR